MKIVRILVGVIVIIVAGNGYAANSHRPECFRASPDPTTIKYEKKDGSYKIAFVNGYVSNDWRIQAIQSASSLGCSAREC